MGDTEKKWYQRFRLSWGKRRDAKTRSHARRAKSQAPRRTSNMVTKAQLAQGLRKQNEKHRGIEAKHVEFESLHHEHTVKNEARKVEHAALKEEVEELKEFNHELTKRMNQWINATNALGDRYTQLEAMKQAHDISLKSVFDRLAQESEERIRLAVQLDQTRPLPTSEDAPSPQPQATARPPVTPQRTSIEKPLSKVHLTFLTQIHQHLVDNKKEECDYSTLQVLSGNSPKSTISTRLEKLRQAGAITSQNTAHGARYAITERGQEIVRKHIRNTGAEFAELKFVGSKKEKKTN